MISKSANSSQAGITLVELLICLSILAMLAGMSSVGIRNALPGLALKQASATLKKDLQWARLRSLSELAPVKILFTETGYKVEALTIDRAWPTGLFFDADIETVSFANGLPSGAHLITLTKAEHSTRITIAPLTGRVTRDDG